MRSTRAGDVEAFEVGSVSDQARDANGRSEVVRVKAIGNDLGMLAGKVAVIVEAAVRNTLVGVSGKATVGAAGHDG